MLQSMTNFMLDEENILPELCKNESQLTICVLWKSVALLGPVLNGNKKLNDL
jgi:hypothetical protein